MTSEEREAARAIARAAAVQRAQRIKDEFKSLRIEDKFRCPHCHDWRLVAAVVVLDGSRCLWVVGGRNERIRATIEEHAAARDYYATKRLSATTETAHRNIDAFVDWHDRYCKQLEQDGGIDVAGWAEPIGPSDSQTDLPAVCPRCHHKVTLRVATMGACRTSPTSPIYLLDS